MGVVAAGGYGAGYSGGYGSNCTSIITGGSSGLDGRRPYLQSSYPPLHQPLSFPSSTLPQIPPSMPHHNIQQIQSSSPIVSTSAAMPCTSTPTNNMSIYPANNVASLNKINSPHLLPNHVQTNQIAINGINNLNLSWMVTGEKGGRGKALMDQTGRTSVGVELVGRGNTQTTKLFGKVTGGGAAVANTNGNNLPNNQNATITNKSNATANTTNSTNKCKCQDWKTYLGKRRWRSFWK